MQTFVWYSSGLHFHSFIAIKSYKVKMQKHVFILYLVTNVFVQSLIIGWFYKFKVLHTAKQGGCDMA